MWLHWPEMKTLLFAAVAGISLVVTGCVGTVSGTKAGGVPFIQDRMQGKYNRSVEQVYAAAKAVVLEKGVLSNEYIPHDTTNTVRALSGKVNQRNVWIRVESVDPAISLVTVQARTKGGGSDLVLTHDLEKLIALKLVE